jgi:hypothetical protein
MVRSGQEKVPSAEDPPRMPVPNNPYFQDFNVVRFTGGPLDGQTRRMDIYVGVIPLELAPDGKISRYYVNVNTVAGIDSQLRQLGAVHYVYFEEGKRV